MITDRCDVIVIGAGPYQRLRLATSAGWVGRRARRRAAAAIAGQVRTTEVGDATSGSNSGAAP